MILPPLQTTLTQTLGEPGPPWFAVLDACDAPEVLEKVAEWGPDRARCLYFGKSQVDYADVAPYLVTVDEAVSHWLLNHMWMHPWGFFVQSSVTLHRLWQHFRHFLRVKDPAGEEVLFRFYDPRILAVFLHHCTTEERRSFFGPCQSFAVPVPAAQEVVMLFERPPELGLSGVSKWQ